MTERPIKHLTSSADAMGVVGPAATGGLMGFERMETMTGYFDESANGRTIVCAGWIGSNSHWDKVTSAWMARLDYENRISVRKGLKLVRRYHAADCASCIGEFAGWTRERQVRFIKKLQDILMTGTPSKIRSHKKPMAFGWAASLAEVLSLPLNMKPYDVRRFCYQLCVWQCLKEIGRVMREYYTNETITFIHDRGNLAGSARKAFDVVIDEDDVCRRQFLDFVPMGWEQAVPLQCADMIAYDLLKALDNRLIGIEVVRRSLKRIVGNNTPIVAGYFPPKAFQLFFEWQSRQK